MALSVARMVAVAASLLAVWGSPSAFAADDKSGLSPNTISLPKGPGSIEGLGEAFQPSLNTGTGKHAVALKLPPEAGGHTPSLALVYDGGSGNGILGLGWSIPLPFVQRQTDKGVPRYVDGPNGVDDDLDGELDEPDELDRFINESSEQLVAVQDGDQFSFFCRNETAFIRYRRVEAHWEGTRPDGTRLVFGETTSACIADPSDPTHVFRWLLESEIDPRGNTIRYRYANFLDETNVGQVYLKTIEYGPGAVPWGGRFHFAFFNYEDRSDWFEDCRSGFPIRTGKRLRDITIGTQGVALAGHLSGDFNADGSPDCLDRRYLIGYQTGAPRSLLANVTQVGADGSTALPPTTYGYTKSFETNELSAAEAGIISANAPPVVFDQSTADFIDLNGDGLPDLLRTSTLGGPHQVYFNQGEAILNGQKVIQWSDAEEVATTPGVGDPWNLSLDQNAVVLADVDGDGLADLVQMTPFDTYYYPNSPLADGTARWLERRPLGATDFIPPSPFGSGGSVRTMDVDFDKRTDIIKSIAVGGSFRYQIWFNRGNDSYSMRTTVAPAKGYDFSTAGVQLADLNGDRLQDVAWIRPSQVLFTASLGNGQFLEERAIPIPDQTLTTAQIAKATLRDVNGDGLADLVVDRPAPLTLWVWLNRGNLTFSDRIVITDLPASLSSSTAVRWVDINGNGTVDMVFGDSSRSETNRVLAVDLGRLFGAVPRPGLLSRIDNGIGRVQTLAYETSTRYALDDGTNSGTYRYSWPYPLPFPVEVVSEIQTADSLGAEYVTRFRYHDGYYDSAEKQFRGFARVEQIDVGDSSAPTLVSHSYFDTGHDYQAMKGQVLRLTTETENGLVFSDVTSAWTVPPITLYTNTNGEAVQYVHPVGQTNRVVELGQGIERRLESEMDFDHFGNQTRHADYGIVSNGDRSAFNDERITTTEYAMNTNAWILRLPARQETKDENGSVISRTESFYDDETFSGNNFGWVTIGNLTLKREWTNPATQAGFISSARTKYDAYGNPITLLDPLASAPGGAVDLTRGHVRQLGYDNQFRTYPVSETIYPGGTNAPLLFQADYDGGFGTVNSATDFNSNVTTYGYDPFARLTSITKPGDSTAYPTVEYDYALAMPTLDGGVVNFVETRQLDQSPGSGGAAKRDFYFISRQFVDGMGRKLMKKSEAEPVPGTSVPRVVVSEAVLFNARQKPVRTLNPFFSLIGGSLDDQLAYENIESSGWQGQFHNQGSLINLNLAAAHATTALYDATLRIIATTNQDGTFRQTVYEPLLTRSYDENQSDPASPYFGNAMVHYNDGLGRLVQVDEVTHLNDDGTAAGSLRAWSTCYEYDLNDNLTHITDSQGNQKEFRYDGLKRKLFINDPDRGTMTYTYDDASNLRSTLDAKSQAISYTYDGVNRLLAEFYRPTNQPPDVTYHYDFPAGAIPLGDGTTASPQNTLGRLASVQDLSGEEHTSYDARGRVSYVVKRIPDPQFLFLSAPGGEGRGGVPLVSYRTGFAYDSLDRVKALTYPDNDFVSYGYNPRNLLNQIVGGPSGVIISNILYPPSAQLQQIDYGNRVRTTYGYDPRLRLNSLITALATNPASPLIAFSYDFDGASNIKDILDNRPASVVAAGDPRRNSQLFAYDDLYRITLAQYSFHTPGNALRNDGQVNYRYDRIGNMLAQTSSLTNTEPLTGLPVANLGTMLSGGAAGSSGRIGRQPNDPPGPHALTSIANLQPPTSNLQSLLSLRRQRQHDRH